MILALAGVGLAWTASTLSYVREREQLMEEIGRMDNALVWRYDHRRFPALPGLPVAPWRVRLFGGYTVEKIILPDEEFSETDRRRIQTIFPEAEVEFGDWPPP